MDQTQQFNLFVAQCEKLLERAVKKTAFVNGQMYSDARIFESPGLNVGAGPGQELEIEIVYKNDGRPGVTQKPVLCRDESGRVYRTHGEWSFARRRLERLLSGESPDTPIRLGKDENGWTTGLD